MSAFSAVLFDLDGTLVDSVGDIAAAMNHVLGALGHPKHDTATIAGFVGEGAHALVARSMPRGATAAEVQHALALYKARYERHLIGSTRPFDGIVTLVRALRGAGLRLGVVTNKPDAPAKAMVSQLFEPGTFGVVVGETEARPRKPDPAQALFAASVLGVEPRRTAFVGDSAVDIETGRAANMSALGVAWGLRPAADLRAAGALAVARDVPELAAALGVALPP